MEPHLYKDKYKYKVYYLVPYWQQLATCTVETKLNFTIGLHERFNTEASTQMIV